ncbi:hypothetical protein AB0A95_30175 [Micromonospora sp. NPDC049230]
MDTVRVPGVLGEPSQDSDELGTFAGVEWGEDLVLVLIGDLACPG